MGQRLAACTGSHQQQQQPSQPAPASAPETKPPVATSQQALVQSPAQAPPPAPLVAPAEPAPMAAPATADAADLAARAAQDAAQVEDEISDDTVAPLITSKVIASEGEPGKMSAGTSGALDSSTRSVASCGDSAVADADALSTAQRDELLDAGPAEPMSRDVMLVGATPPPASDELPEVSLMDIMSSGKTRVSRSRSRRASNTSMASLSAIPENLELTPLSVRADSTRLSLQALDKSHSKRDTLGDVNELDMESKSASLSRHSNRQEASVDSSPRSSISSLLNGDDSIMPPDYEYQMLMPILARPRAYKRLPNATEAIRSLSMRDSAVAQEAPAPEAPSGAADADAPTSPVGPGASPGAAPFLGHTTSAAERAAVATDEAGLKLLESVTMFDDGEADVELTADELRIVPLGEQGPPEYSPVQQGRVQQESIKFELAAPVQGLRCVKKYQVGEISWSQTVVMGDFDAGVHSYQFEESQVPKGSLSLGKYDMKTVFMDSHGQYLWAAVNQFEVVKKVVD